MIAQKGELEKARAGELGFIIHRHDGGRVLKVLSVDIEKLRAWARANGIPAAWVVLSRSGMPHIDLWGKVAERFLERGVCGNSIYSSGKI